MKLHEYQAKELLRAAGVPTPQGTMVTTSDDVVTATFVVVELEKWLRYGRSRTDHALPE